MKNADIVVYITAPLWDRRIEEKPSGGSYVSLVNLTRELAKRGYVVHVYSDCKERNDTTHGNLSYIRIQNFYESTGSINCKLFILYRTFDPTFDLSFIKAERKVVWSQDNKINEENAIELLSNHINGIICVSDLHVKMMIEQVGIKWSSVIHSIYNPLDVECYEDVDRLSLSTRELSGVYLSHPSRGLNNLLSIYPLIRKLKKDFELKVYSSLLPYAYYEKKSSDEKMSYFIKRMKREDGIEWVRGYGRPRLLKELSKTSLFLYPTDFVELFCYSFAQSLACGVVPVVTSTGVFIEYSKMTDCLTLIDTSKEDWMDIFSCEVVKLFNDSERMKIRSKECIKFARNTFDVKNVADKWEEICFQK